MRTIEIFQKLRDTFFKRIVDKTGWEKNEIMIAYNESVEEVLFDMLDDKEKNG